jgi:hypothetical protein
MLFLDYAGNTDGRKARGIDKGVLGDIYFHLSRGWLRASVVCEFTINPRYFFHIVHVPFGGCRWIGHWLVASLSGSSPLYILGRIHDRKPVAISDILDTLRKLRHYITLVNSGDEDPCLIKFSMRNESFCEYPSILMLW